MAHGRCRRSAMSSPTSPSPLQFDDPDQHPVHAAARRARPRARRSPTTTSSTTASSSARRMRLTRARPRLHPGAALSLLRHGDRQSRLHHAWRGDDLSRARGSSRWRAARLSQTERCTALYGVPTMFIAELGHPDFKRFDLASLRTGIMAGSPCPIEVMRRCVSEMHMREVTIAYGMTETSPVSTQTADRRPARAPGRHGRAHSSACRGEDRRSRGAHRRRRGTPGELCTRGYLGHARLLGRRGAHAEAIDRAGWMHTGDLATHGRGRLLQHRRAHQRHGHPRRREHLSARGRGIPLPPSRRSRTVQVFGVPDAALWRGTLRLGQAEAQARARRARRSEPSARARSPITKSRATCASSTSSR